MIRWSKVREIRKQIAEGNYVTEEKLETTADGLLKELLPDTPLEALQFFGVHERSTGRKLSDAEIEAKFGSGDG